MDGGEVTYILLVALARGWQRWLSAAGAAGMRALRNTRIFTNSIRLRICTRCRSRWTPEVAGSFLGFYSNALQSIGVSASCPRDMPDNDAALGNIGYLRPSLTTSKTQRDGTRSSSFSAIALSFLARILMFRRNELSSTSLSRPHNT